MKCGGIKEKKSSLERPSRIRCIHTIWKVHSPPLRFHHRSLTSVDHWSIADRNKLFPSLYHLVCSWAHLIIQHSHAWFLVLGSCFLLLASCFLLAWDPCIRMTYKDLYASLPSAVDLHLSIVQTALLKQWPSVLDFNHHLCTNTRHSHHHITHCLCPAS